MRVSVPPTNFTVCDNCFLVYQKRYVRESKWLFSRFKKPQFSLKIILFMAIEIK